MKRLGWILVLLMAASPAWAARKVNIVQLKDLLVSLHEAKKTDAEVAAELEQIELTEQLSRSTMNVLNDYIPGQSSSEQFFVLEARSAALPPPAADLPTAPPPDPAAQKAILDKAVNYVTTSFAQLPHLTATKNTFRFQDSMEAPLPADPKSKGGDASKVDPSQIVHFLGSAESPVETMNGAENIVVTKEKQLQGQSDQVMLLGQGPILSSILQEAQAAGTLKWARWETLNGTQVAVLSFVVEKKKSHYAVNYCCFSATALTTSADAMSRGNYGTRGGVSTDSTTSTQSISGMGAAFNNGMPRLPGTDWRSYKGTVPYHGEFFVDPATGVVTRLVTVAEFKSTELVQREDQRIDYGPMPVGGKTLVVPVKAVISTEEVPNGYGGYGKHNNRRTLFTIDYKDYQPAGAGAAEHK